MASRAARLSHAVRDKLRDNKPYKLLVKEYDIPETTLKRHVMNESQSVADLELYSTSDWQDHPDPDGLFRIKNDPRGRPTTLQPHDEKVIAEAAAYFADNNTPLSRKCLLDMVQDYVQSLPHTRQRQIGFKDGRPSINWLYSFLNRNPTLAVQRRKCIEEKRIDAISPEFLSKHFVRTEALMQKFNINDPSRVFNIDESGISAKLLAEKSSERAIGRRHTRRDLVSSTLEVKINADRCTIMPVISASGRCFNPVIVFKGKHAVWRKVNGESQTVHTFCPPGSYVYYRDIAGVDRSIFHCWATKFVDETIALRSGGKKILLVFDSYAGHIGYRTLSYLKQNGIVCLGLPAHSSHVLQPLDVSLFAPFKTHLRSEVHNLRLSPTVRKLDVFALAEIITNAYNKAFTIENIVSGFSKTGLWHPTLHKASTRALMNVRFTSGVAGGLEITNGDSTQSHRVGNFMDLVELFRGKRRCLLSDGVVEEQGTIKIDSSAGVNYSSDEVLAALRRREERRTAERRRIAAAQAAKEKRKAERQRDQEDAAAKKRKKMQACEDREEAELQRLKSDRTRTRNVLSRTRASRRRAAALRAERPGIEQEI